MERRETDNYAVFDDHIILPMDGPAGEVVARAMLRRVAEEWEVDFELHTYDEDDGSINVSGDAQLAWALATECDSRLAPVGECGTCKHWTVWEHTVCIAGKPDEHQRDESKGTCGRISEGSKETEPFIMPGLNAEGAMLVTPRNFSCSVYARAAQ